MAWLSRTNWQLNQPLAPSDFNSWGLDIRTQGGDADGGSYGRSNHGWLGLIPADPVGTAYTVTGITWSNGFATYTIGAHKIVANQTISVVSANPTNYNQTNATVTSVTATTVTIAMSSNPGAWVSGGTLTVTTANGSGPSTGMLAVNGSGSLQIYQSGAWASVGGSSPGAWQSLTLQNSWAALAGYQTPSYRLELGGSVVRLHGVISGGTAANGTVIFTLPAGAYNTSFTVRINSIGYQSTAATACGLILSIDSATGNVSLVHPPSDLGQIDLDGCSFAIA